MDAIKMPVLRESPLASDDIKMIPRRASGHLPQLWNHVPIDRRTEVVKR